MKQSDLFREKTLPEIFKEEVENVYENSVKTAMQQCGGDELIAGVLVYSAIASTYDILKRDKYLLLTSGLTELEYGKLMENICDEMLNKYLQSY
jgi:hypothetical protein